MHRDRLAEYYGGIGNFVYTRARVPEHVRAQFIVREDNQIQLQERLVFVLMFGIFGEHTQTSYLYCFCDSAAVELAMSKSSAKGVA